jgi:5'-3' exonuclease
MGIPSYFSHIIKNYPNIILSMNFIKNNITNFNHLYMDCNSIIYDVFNSIKEEAENNIDHFEKKIIDLVIDKIKFYISLISPNKTVYIAFDGVAPLAKMEQQRKRRYKNATPNSNKWSTSNITPGTSFMKALSELINAEFSNFKHTAKIIVSSSNEHGEGEHKLFKYIRSQKIDPEDNAFVYGLDSDLIMLSIFHCKYFKKIYIFREAPEFGKLKEPKKDEKKPDFYFMDIDILSNSILNEMQCGVPDKNRVYDYVLFCFLLGNDFLPHFPSLNIRTNGVQILIDTYRKYIGNYENRFLSIDGKIQWKWVSLFIQELAKRENDYLIGEYDLRNKFDGKSWKIDTELNRDAALQSIPIIYRSEELYICPSERGWENRYYKCLFDIHVSKESVCKNYAEGLEWVFKYYTKDCSDWRWKYNYHYPPLLTDLSKYVPKISGDLIVETVNNKFPVKGNVQLAYVLPKCSHSIISKCNRDLLAEKYFMLYPEKYETQWAFCRYLWEAHVVLPQIEIDTLNEWDLTLQ